MKLNSVRKGWRLLRVLSVRVEPAKLYRGRLPYFEPTVLGEDGKTVERAGGWRGGDKWLSNPIPGPWGLPGVI